MSDVLDDFMPLSAKTIFLDYSDYIAKRISDTLRVFDDARIIDRASHPKSDLHPTSGYLLTCKKTVHVMDKNGREYIVTVESVKEQNCTSPMDGDHSDEVRA